MPNKSAEEKDKTRKKINPSSRCSSRTNSRNGTPVGSPSKTNTVETNEVAGEDESWTCERCQVNFVSPEDMLMECQCCKEHYCIKCLGKTPEEYRILSKSDSMWFCHKCREKVEKNIITDRKIEEKCKEMMLAFESRLVNIESYVKTKCDPHQV